MFKLKKLFIQRHRETGVFFVGDFMKKKIRPKTIYCPSCGRKVMTYDGIHSMIIGNNCKKCDKRVVYNPITNETMITSIPKRTSSSGMKAGTR